MCQQSCSRTWFPHSERLPGHDKDYADTDGKQTEKPREKSTIIIKMGAPEVGWVDF